MATTSSDYRKLGLSFAAFESVSLLLLVAFLLYKTNRVFKVKGLTLNLLFIEFFGAVCSFSQFIIATVATKDRSAATHNNGVLISFTVLAGLKIGSNYIVLWIFALKYWSLSLKLQLIQTKQDQNRLNTLFLVLLYSGLSLISLVVILSGTSLLELA